MDEKSPRVPLARQFAPTSGFFWYCKKILDTLKSCFQGNVDLKPSSDGRINVKSSEYYSTLMITKLSRQDCGLYMCKIQNSAGICWQTIKISQSNLGQFNKCTIPSQICNVEVYKKQFLSLFKYKLEFQKSVRSDS